MPLNFTQLNPLSAAKDTVINDNFGNLATFLYAVIESNNRMLSTVVIANLAIGAIFIVPNGNNKTDSTNWQADPKSLAIYKGNNTWYYTAAPDGFFAFCKSILANNTTLNNVIVFYQGSEWRYLPSSVI